MWVFAVTVYNSKWSLFVFYGCSKYSKSLDFASNPPFIPRFIVFEFSIMLKAQCINWAKSNTYNRCQGSDTPLLTAFILVVILRLFYRSWLIFLTKMPSYVLNMKKNPCINEQKSPKCKIKFPFIWLWLLWKLGYSCSKDHFSNIPQ